MFKRIFAFTLAALMLLFAAAPAETEIWYISYGDYGEPIGDLQMLLGVHEKYYDDYYFGDVTYDALDAFQYEMDLERTGCFDDATLEALLGVRARSEEDTWLVWVPMFGGTRYHASAACGGMMEPRQMELICAEALGYYPCMRVSCFG